MWSARRAAGAVPNHRARGRGGITKGWPFFLMKGCEKPILPMTSCDHDEEMMPARMQKAMIGQQQRDGARVCKKDGCHRG